jgi:hypothetical protein
MAVRGDDAHKIMQRCGHKSFSTTMLYVREGEAIREGFGDPFPPLPSCLVDPSEGFAMWLGDLAALDARDLFRADPLEIGPPEPVLEPQPAQRGPEARVLRDTSLLCTLTRLRVEFVEDRVGGRLELSETDRLAPVRDIELLDVGARAGSAREPGQRYDERLEVATVQDKYAIGRVDGAPDKEIIPVRRGQDLGDLVGRKERDAIFESDNRPEQRMEELAPRPLHTAEKKETLISLSRTTQRREAAHRACGRSNPQCVTPMGLERLLGFAL